MAVHHAAVRGQRVQAHDGRHRIAIRGQRDLADERDTVGGLQLDVGAAGRQDRIRPNGGHVVNSSHGGARSSSPDDPRRTVVPRPPARGVPMPPIGQIAPAIGRPRHDVRDARRYLLVTSRTAVGLRGRVAGNRSHQPLSVARRVHPLHTAAGAAFVQRRRRRRRHGGVGAGSRCKPTVGRERSTVLGRVIRRTAGQR